VGTPVFRGGATAFGTGTKVVFGFTPRATTSWKCTIVSAWREPFVTPEGGGSPTFGEAVLAVNDSNIFETRLINSSHGVTSLVLPWWGAHFSGSQKVVWSQTTTQQCHVHASWLGEEE
jgi:hypothetical protein